MPLRKTTVPPVHYIELWKTSEESFYVRVVVVVVFQMPLSVAICGAAFCSRWVSGLSDKSLRVRNGCRTHPFIFSIVS